MQGCGNRVLCRNLFKKLEILPLTSQYMLSLLMFVVQNKNFFLPNNENHNIDTRQRSNLYLPQANLINYQKSHSSMIFRLQKKAIRIMEGCENRVSCRNLFMKLEF